MGETINGVRGFRATVLAFRTVCRVGGRRVICSGTEHVPVPRSGGYAQINLWIGAVVAGSHDGVGFI